MELERLMIQLPTPLKQRLDELRKKGYTASGFIRALLERELNGKEGSSNGRET